MSTSRNVGPHAVWGCSQCNRVVWIGSLAGRTARSGYGVRDWRCVGRPMAGEVWRGETLAPNPPWPWGNPL